MRRASSKVRQSFFYATVTDEQRIYRVVLVK
jgi:hypothetical protein